MLDFFCGQIKKKEEIVKFVISGGAAALANFGLFYLLTEVFGFWYLFSSGLSFVASFFVSFFLQKFWTFKDKNKDILYEQMALYLLMAFLNLAFNTAAMYALVDVFGVWNLLAQFLVIIVVSFWNFIAYKFLIFKRASEMKA